MRNIALFAAVAAVFIVIGIDAWFCTRTITSAALAGSSFNRLIVATGAKASTISRYDDYLSGRLEWQKIGEPL